MFFFSLVEADPVAAVTAVVVVAVVVIAAIITVVVAAVKQTQFVEFDGTVAWIRKTKEERYCWLCIVSTSLLLFQA